jgi:hypothetical protein
MEKKRKKRFGDRPDGRRLRTIAPVNALMPFIMKTRNASDNSISDSIEITETERFLRKLRLEGYPGLGLLHLFIATYIRAVSQYPAINRFISGQRIFARNNIIFVMTIKKGMSINANETSIKVIFDPRDTIYDVYNKLNAEIEKVRGETGVDETEDAAKIFLKFPRIMLKFVVWLLGVLDYFGKLPKSILEVSPFHGSVIITDMGSIGTPPVFHHLYDFGNMPLFIGLGAKRKSRELAADGTVIEKKYIDFNLVMDERVVDGFYFSQVIKLFKSLVRKPESLTTPPEVVNEDVD